MSQLRPFEKLMHDVTRHIALAHGGERSVLRWAFDPTETNLAKRWTFRVDILGDAEIFHGESGESALRRALEYYVRRNGEP